jgi:dolichyl-phosphate-mannose-protein mannosyltransferase
MGTATIEPVVTNQANSHRTVSPFAGGENFLPEGSRSDRWIAAGVFLLTCLYLSLFYNYTILNADEGIVLQGAQRILAGQVLYRDFFSFYTPGSYYWMALLFKIFGSSILVGRTALIVYGGLFSLLAYLLARRVCARWSALLAAYMVTLTCVPFRFNVLHNWDSTLLAYLALYFAVLLLERRHWFWALAAGTLGSLTVLFEHSKGAGLALGLTIGFALLAWRGGIREWFDRRQLAALAGGFVWPFLPTFAYFSAHHAVREMLAGWLWPLFHYSAANKLPYGYLVMSTTDRGALFRGDWIARAIVSVTVGPVILLPLLPIVAIVVLCWFAYKSWRNKSASPRRCYFILISSCLCGLLISAFLTGRPDFTHLNYMGPLFYLVIAWAIDGLTSRWRFWRFVAPVPVFCIFVSSTAFGMAMLLESRNAQHLTRTVHGTIRTREADPVLAYLQQNSKPGERILVYPYQALYYYLSGTFSPTSFDFLQPGMHSPEQFEQALNEIRTQPTGLVIFETSFADKIPLGWPNTPKDRIAANDPVADYIRAHYQPCAALSPNDFWHFTSMVRNDLSCPSSGGKPAGE